MTKSQTKQAVCVGYQYLTVILSLIAKRIAKSQRQNSCRIACNSALPTAMRVSARATRSMVSPWTSSADRSRRWQRCVAMSCAKCLAQRRNFARRPRGASLRTSTDRIGASKPSFPPNKPLQTNRITFSTDSTDRSRISVEGKLIYFLPYAYRSIIIKIKVHFFIFYMAPIYIYGGRCRLGVARAQGAISPY